MHLPYNDKLNGVEGIGSSGTLPELNDVKTGDATRNSASDAHVGESIVFDTPIFHQESDDPETPVDVLLLAWFLVLYRYSGDTLSQFSWGYSASINSNSNDSTQLPSQSLSASQISVESSDTVAKIGEGLRLLRRQENTAVSSQPWQYGTSVFFHNGSEPSQKTGDSWRVEPDWTFQIEASVDKDRRVWLKPHWRGASMMRHQAIAQLHAFIDILHDVLQDRTKPVSKFLEITESELDGIWQWNATVPPNIEQCMHTLISERAATRPDHPAVHGWDGEFTYAQLDDYSTRFAHKFAALGVRIGTVVPLCFEKSIWTVVAALGVMKAGGAFALTDPSQPEGRLKTIVEQTGATIIGTSQMQYELGRLIAPHSQGLVVSKSTLDVMDGISEAGPLPTVPASSPLYIIFTSGSTGKPKGVVLSHANYTSGALPRADAVGYRDHSRVLDFASYAFDVSIDCMLCTLVQGGCICIPSEEARINDLSGAIRSMNANMAHMTPSVARLLDPDILPTLEVLGLGGESVSAGDASNWGKKTNVIIAYGPSECTVGCTINNDVGVGRPYTTIGKGVGGTTWIVDPTNHDRLVPPGAIGELLIEGPIVGIGYLNEPEKTAQVFIEDPVWLVAGSKNVPGRRGRLYKTGDLVRYDPDGAGCIAFVGRGDQQVKLRGQRVELAEIEHHLRSNLPAGVSVAAEVISPGGKGSEPTLVAFLAEQKEEGREQASTTNDQELAFSTALQQALVEIDKELATKLPIYMVPSAYIPLKEMPLLVSCKTDRKQLRAIGAAMSRQQLARLRVATVEKHEPATEMERKLHKLWVQLLGSDVEISTRDSFFALGGDSLRAMKLVAAARTEGVSLTVASIFSHPTLADMASHAGLVESETRIEVPPFSLLGSELEVANAQTEAGKYCGINVSSVEDIYPCTPLQEGLMALSAKISQAYVAQRVVQLEPTVAQKLYDAFKVAATECPILRTRIIQSPGHGLVQVVVKEAPLCHTGGNLEEYLRTDREDPMELGKALVRFAIISDSEEGAQKAHFVLTMHHALYDGWSMPLVVDRVNRAYQGLKTDRPAAFKVFIKYLSDLDKTESEAYWRTQLKGANGVQFPQLPFTGYQTQADSLLEEYVSLPKRNTSSTTVATAIRGAWALVASQYIASDDVIFGETLTGRNAPIVGVDEIEGPMIATVPIRIQLNRDMAIAEYLQEIHDQTVLRIPHEHTGLQHIRRLSPEAREACELRTGLVLHPSAEADQPVEVQLNQPANGFVPAGDAEAAREALKFNTYALMLVCSLDPNGFLIMASFDSNTVNLTQMKSILSQFSRIVRQFCEAPATQTIGDIEFLTEEERIDLWKLSTSKTAQLGLINRYNGVTATWIVDAQNPEQLLPRGAMGELLFESTESSTLRSIESPSWLKKGCSEIAGRQTHLYKTSQLARYAQDGSITLLGTKEEIAKPVAEMQERQATATRLAAKSAKQRKLRQIWARTLGLPEEEIGLNDSFFQLGGDSIGAMKLVSEARLDGYRLTVAQVFRHRPLYDMASVLEELEPSQTTESKEVVPFAALDISDIDTFVAESIRPALMDPSWKIVDVLPTRPLQKVATKATIQLPRYSARYELFYLDSDVDKSRLFESCQGLVSRNEILRTVFVEAAGDYFGVVLEDLTVPIVEYEIEGDLPSFCEKLCNLDIQTRMPAGSSFVKFLFVQGENGQSCLLFRLSHAQYDEICLPLCLKQLSALYEGRPVPEATPFSAFINHVVHENIPKSKQYWKDLLQGSSLSVLKPHVPVDSKTAVAVYKDFDISARSKDITVATLPTAAWALCLARHLSVRDVVFGEVVSGRNIDLPQCEMVMGPCWQYIPVRVKFEDNWRAIDLLNFIQHQHIASTSFEGMGLTEIVKNCTDWPQNIDWFDSVVHQDADHVTSLKFLSANSRMETIYPHAEPLKEWKIQAFPDGDKLRIEIVTFESWLEPATALLEDIATIMNQLIHKPRSHLFEQVENMSG